MRLVLLAALLQTRAAVAGDVFKVELRRDPEIEGPVRSWFSAQDRVLEAFSEAEALAAHPSSARSPTGARRMLELARSMADAYREMTGDDSAARDLAGLAAGLKPDDALSLGPGGLYRWIHLIRQGALDAPGPKGILPARSSLTLRFEGRQASTALMVLSPPTADPAKSAALRALANAMRRMPGADLGPAILGERRAWLSLHDVEIFGDFSPCKSGGTVRARYRELGAGLGERSRLYFLAQALYLAGFSVGLEGGRLEAEWGEGRLSEEDMLEGWFLALAVAEISESLPPVLGPSLRGMEAKERQERLSYLARVFVAEGSIPFLGKDGAAGFSRGLEEYRAKEPEREAARAKMSRALTGLGLGDFPAEAGVGRRSIELYYERVLEAAQARGEIAASGAGARRLPYEPSARLAALPGSSDAAALWPVAHRFTPVGLVGRQRALRAQWRLAADDWLTIYALARGPGDFTAAVVERGSVRARAELPLPKALALLRDGGFLPAWGPREPKKGQSSPGEDGAIWGSAVFGPLARGPVSGPATYDLDRPAKGAVCLTPFLRPADAPRLKACGAVLASAGTPIAAAAAEEAGVPGMELPQSEWGAGGLRVRIPFFGAPRGSARVRSLSRLRLIVLKEGQRVRVDPAQGALYLAEPAPPPASGSLALPAASGGAQ